MLLLLVKVVVVKDANKSVDRQFSAPPPACLLILAAAARQSVLLRPNSRLDPLALAPRAPGLAL